jgi:signal transduction histidine kinase
VRLGYEPLGTRLVVEDFEPDGARAAAPNGQGYGLTGMRERAELLDGTLTAAPTDTGFRVELWVPA